MHHVCFVYSNVAYLSMSYGALSILRLQVVTGPWNKHNLPHWTEVTNRIISFGWADFSGIHLTRSLVSLTVVTSPS